MIHILDAEIKEAYADAIWVRVDALNGAEELHAANLDDLLDQLENYCGIDPSTTKATVSNYNTSVRESGRDTARGRTNLVGTTGSLVPVAAAPYIAIVTKPGTHFNRGLQVDTDARVIGVFGEPIEGLFTAGELMGGFHGAGYLSGTQWGQAVIFGRIAGMHAAGSPTAQASAQG